MLYGPHIALIEHILPFIHVTEVLSIQNLAGGKFLLLLPLVIGGSNIKLFF